MPIRFKLVAGCIIAAMNREVNFAIAQMDVIPGHPDKNVAKILKETELAKKRKIDVIIFPEMAVPGYLLGDEWENDAFIRDLMGFNEKILAASSGIAVMWGNVQADFTKVGEDGRSRKYNAVHIAQEGEWVNNGVFPGHTFKTLEPKYREFDDERHFFSMLKLAVERGVDLSDLLKPFPIAIGNEVVPIGAILCEDMWWVDYGINPSHILVKNGAEVIVNISCSPWTWRKNDKRHRVVKSILEKDPVPFIYDNNVGVQNNGKNLFLFDGATTVYNADGSIMQTAHDYQEETIDVTVGPAKKTEFTPVALSHERDTEELYQGLIYGIRKFCNQLNKKTLLGISGGIDSALSTSLLVDALGKDAVLGVNMPSRFNADVTKNAARKLAQNLGIEYRIYPIQASVDLTVKELEGMGYTVTSDILENIQARDRGGRVLPALAASLDRIFVNNGNKTEVALGYATLYGDINGAVAPLGDLFKYEIYQLAEFINKLHGSEVIPQEILDLVPSAELSEEQDVTKGKGDPILYPYHDKLLRAFIEFRRDPEDILDMYRNGTLEDVLLVNKGLVNRYFPTAKQFIDDLEQKWRLFKINYFKRIQAPPIIAVSKRAFGYDLRESQNGVYFTERFKELKKEILNDSNRIVFVNKH